MPRQIGELGDLSDFNESLGGFSSARIGLAAAVIGLMNKGRGFSAPSL